MSKRQYLYICSNPSMPGLLKIGKTTTDPHERSAALFSTGVPTPFVVEYSWIVTDCSACERLTHQALESYRVSKQREFFRVSLKTALKKALAVVATYEQPERRSVGDRRSKGSAQDRRGAKSTKNAGKVKAASPKSVIAPAEWPFPTSSRP